MTRAPARWSTMRLLVAGVSSVVAVAVLLSLLGIVGGGSGYTVRVDLADAGQLVDGDLVEVGGIPVGTVNAMQLTGSDVAQLTLAMHAFTPLHQGTTVSVGTVGLSGVTNRFLAVEPGPRSAPVIRSGALIPEQATTPIVDLDELLDMFTPRLRENLRQLLQEYAGALRGNVGAARQTLDYAAAAIERGGDFIGQVVEDRTAFNSLLTAGASTASALAAPQSKLTAAVSNTASALTALAAVRSALSDALQRAPAALDDGTAFLDRLRPTLAALDPVLADARPVAAPLAALLRELVPTAAQAAPVLQQLTAVLPTVDRLLSALPALSHVAVPALNETEFALKKALPIFTGLRPYGDDILLGFLHGYGGGSSENYDADGQFSRISLGLPASTLLTAELGESLPSLSKHFLVGQTNKCPGSAAEPAPDKSNVVHVDGCDPKETP